MAEVAKYVLYLNVLTSAVRSLEQVELTLQAA